MSSTSIAERGTEERHESFRHDAMFYAGSRDFVDRTASFIRDSVRAEEPILVVVSAEKIDMLRTELNGHADGVRFADMAAVGQNPARIIPAWRAFVAERSTIGRRFRGIGEPNLHLQARRREPDRHVQGSVWRSASHGNGQRRRREVQHKDQRSRPEHDCELRGKDYRQGQHERDGGVRRAWRRNVDREEKTIIPWSKISRCPA